MNRNTMLYTLAAAANVKTANYPMTPLGAGGAGGTPMPPPLPKPMGAPAPVTGTLGAGGAGGTPGGHSLSQAGGTMGVPGQPPSLASAGGTMGTPGKITPPANPMLANR